jgi:hypothetical protein
MRPHNAHISQNSRLLVLVAFIWLNVLFGLASNIIGGHTMTRPELIAIIKSIRPHDIAGGAILFAAPIIAAIIATIVKTGV